MKKFFTCFVCGILILSTATPSFAYAKSNKNHRGIIQMSAENKSSQDYVEGEVLVKFKKKKPRKGFQFLASENFEVRTRNIEKTQKMKAKRKMKNVNAVLFEKQDANVEKMIADLKNDPEIESVQPNYVYKVSEQTKYWNIGDGNDSGVNADLVHSETTGNGVTVAVIDTGIDWDHPDLGANHWTNSGETNCLDGVDNDGNGFIDDCNGWDFVGDNINLPNPDNDPLDQHGHGTHVAGTIAAVNNDLGVLGVAPNAKLMPVKVLDSNGYGTSATVIAGIDYARENHADIINMSLGGSGNDPLMEAAVNDAYNAGIVVVAASGNEGSSTPHYPAAYPNVISVGAVDSNRNLASFSNTGSALDLVAPGVDIISTYPEYLTPSGFIPYAISSGTSMATPHVSGLAALYLEKNPTATPAQVQTALENGAIDLGTIGRDDSFGYGAANAVGLLAITPPPADTTPPVVGGSNITLPAGITTTTLEATTDENATCKYDTTANIIYGSMTNTFGTTGTTLHQEPISGLTDGEVRNYFIRCKDGADNANTADYQITVTVQTPTVNAGDIVINELAWAGSSASTSDEWIELRNTTSSAIDLTGFEITKNTGSESIMTTITSGTIPANGFFLISHFDAAGSALNITPDVVDASVSLSNSALQLKLYSGDFATATLIDTAGDGSTPLAGDNGTVKKTMSRKDVPTDGTLAANWFTSEVAGNNYDGSATEKGTPREANTEGVADTTPPVRSNGAPTGQQPVDTTSVTLEVTTDENATCKYDTTANTAYDSMTNTFGTTGTTSHSTAFGGLTNGGSYEVFVRCADVPGNKNIDDFSISFSIAVPVDSTPPVISGSNITLPAGITTTTLEATTDENATCKYDTTANIVYDSMTNTFGTTGTTLHQEPISGLTDGEVRNYFIRCKDGADNANTADYQITVTVQTPIDSTPPVRTNGAPTGEQVANTTSVNLQVTTDENATCKYSTTANTAYDSMIDVFGTTGGTTAHSSTFGGLTNGQSYTVFVRCADTIGNMNTDDYAISFSVANPTSPPPAGEGTLYEDGNDASDWQIYDNSPNTPVTPSVTAQGGKIVTSGNGTGNLYGMFFPAPNTTQFIAQWEWELDTNQLQRIYFRVSTNEGIKYLRYRPENKTCASSGSTYVYCGVGTGAANGQPQVFTRDLVADMHTAKPSVTINSVSAVYIRGDSKIDEIRLLGGEEIATYSISGTVTTDGNPLANATISFSNTSLPAPASVLTDTSGNYVQTGFIDGQTYTVEVSASGTDFSLASIQVVTNGNKTVDFAGATPPLGSETLYEDGIDASDWSIFDNSPTTPITPSVTAQNGMIKTESNGTQNGFQFNLPSVNTSQFVAQWDWKLASNQLQRFYFRLNTNKGIRYIRYRPEFKDCSGTGTYVYCGVGPSVANGSANTITRDLEADLHAAQPDANITNIDRIYLRGSMEVDNILLKD